MFLVSRVAAINCLQIFMREEPQIRTSSLMGIVQPLWSAILSVPSIAACDRSSGFWWCSISSRQLSNFVPERRQSRSLSLILCYPASSNSPLVATVRANNLPSSFWSASRTCSRRVQVHNRIRLSSTWMIFFLSASSMCQPSTNPSSRSFRSAYCFWGLRLPSVSLFGIGTIWVRVPLKGF